MFVYLFHTSVPSTHYRTIVYFYSILLYEIILKVGDVVLVHDESVLENELNLVGLESLV